MVESIFFDVDGTLYDYTNAEIKAKLAVAGEVAQASSLTLTEAYQRFSDWERRTIELDPDDPKGIERELWCRGMLEELSLPNLDAAQLARDYWDAWHRSIEPYADTVPVLEELSNIYALHAVTDELQPFALERLKCLGIAGYFGRIVTPTDTGVLKPHPRALEYALEQTGSRVETSVMIGDNPARDMAVAKAIGVKSIRVRRGKYFFLEGADVPTAEVTALLEIPGLIRSM